MKLFLDYHTRAFPVSLTTPGVTVQSITFKRRDNDEVEVVFAKGTQHISLPEGTTGQLGIKRLNDFGGNYLAFSDSWTVSGPAQAPVYIFRLNLNTTEINGIFEADPVAPINAMLEITWTTLSGVVSTSSTLTTRIVNDVVVGGETVPATSPSTKATQTEAVQGVSNDKWMTPLRTKEAINAQVPALIDTSLDGFVVPDHDHGVSDLLQSGATPGQVLEWNGTAWAPASPSASLSSTKRNVKVNFIRRFNLDAGFYVYPSNYTYDGGRETLLEFSYGSDSESVGMPYNETWAVTLNDTARTTNINNPLPPHQFGDIFRVKFNSPDYEVRGNKLEISSTYGPTSPGSSFSNDTTRLIATINESPKTESVVYGFIHDGEKWVPEHTLSSGATETPGQAIRGQVYARSTPDLAINIAFPAVGVYVNPQTASPAMGSIPTNFVGDYSYGVRESHSEGFYLRNTSGRSALLNISAFAEVMFNGSSVIFGMALAKNGLVDVNTIVTENSSTNNPAFLSTNWMIYMNNGDYVQVYFAQVSGTTPVSLLSFRSGRLVVTEVR